MSTSITRQLFQGMSARTQYGLRSLAHELRLRDDDLVRALRQIDDIVDRSRDLIANPPVSTSSDGPVIVWTVKGAMVPSATEALLAHALRLRGADARVFICDAFLPGCDARNISQYPEKVVNEKSDAKICDRCFFLSQQIFERFRLPYALLSHQVGPDSHDRAGKLIAPLSPEEIFDLEYKGLHLGRIIHSSVVRFFKRVNLLLDDSQTRMMTQRYAIAAVLMTDIAEHVFDELRPRALLTSHGIYVSWAIVMAMAQQRGIPVTVWARGYRRSTLMVCQGDTYYEEMLAEPSSYWEGMELGPERAAKLNSYLGNRWGAEDGVALFRTAVEDREQIRNELGLDPAKPTLGLFPNVGWDGQVNNRNIAFPDIFAWILETVRVFIDRPDRQLVVRVHPMEGWLLGGAQQTIIDEINRNFPDLPGHIKVIPPESQLSSYSLIDLINAGAVHGTQFGLEMACRGLPVIVTGASPFRTKGFTYDVGSPEEYFEIVERFDSLPMLDEDKVQRALKYAYHLYFRRMMPFKFVESTIEEGRSAFDTFQIDSLHDLLPGRNEHLDLITEGILQDKPVFAEPS